MNKNVIEIHPAFPPIFPFTWCSAWGEDRHGIWIEFTLTQGEKKVKQRMRWINPGSFMMGSPENEDGRLENELQHQVTITQGYWMFDTPVTQALWAAIIGNNPSRFQSGDRPVEQVSWEECRRFIERINQIKPGLELRLPTEAQWEYACRAGSAMSTPVGELAIISEYNAPALDPIAWYGGNSGTKFDLKHGYDTNGWPNKQYPDNSAGTHPVAEKLPNVWGLYDMIGNVWEWCADWYGDYPCEAIVDPIGPMEATYRILRGGSWYSIAGCCRSASRGYGGPAYRHEDDIGFRLSRGQ